MPENDEKKKLTVDDVPPELTLGLRKPISLKDRTISEITLREPTAQDIEQVSKRAQTNPASSNILLVSRVSGLTEGEINMMGISDLNKALKYLMVFIESDQEIGKT